MPTSDEGSNDAVLSRDDLVAMISRAHAASSSYEDCAAAGRALAAQSKLPKLVAENLGAGFGQWDFFPDVADVVDFAFSYVPPQTAEDMWPLARAWAADDAAKRTTVLALVGLDILQHELRRIEVPELRELVDETRPAAALATRARLGLAVPPTPPPKTPKKESPKAAPRAEAPRAESAAPTPHAPPAAKHEGTSRRMPKPVFVRPPPPAAPPPPTHVRHPKFGEGVLEARDGVGPDAKLTIKFASGSKTLLARYVTEIPS